MKNLTPLEIAKFWMLVKIDITTPLKYNHDKCLGHCWIWQGSFYLSGYGRMGINNKTYRSHRISYYLVYGEISSKNLICHKCDNPSCVNPEHLFQGTSKENTQDMIEKGRRVKKGEIKHIKIERAKKVKGSSQYKGVCHLKVSGKWRAVFVNKGKIYYIGVYKTELEAAKAYDDYIIKNGFDNKLNLTK